MTDREQSVARLRNQVREEIAQMLQSGVLGHDECAEDVRAMKEPE